MRRGQIHEHGSLSPALTPSPGGAIPVTETQRRLASKPAFARAAKRLFDLVFAALVLLATSPLLLLLAAIIPLESRGSPLYRQLRMGFNQRPFTLIKLRTMDADGRATRIGALLRPLGLDELPQLWNVLKGEMSIVGPRPEVLDRVPGHQRVLPDYWARHLVRPGITGWAQINGLRGHVSIAERLRFDLDYVADWNLLLDVRILFLTTAAVWRDSRRAWWQR
jgi:lipopolysaccharide/colanic/teichoic acid biosynthesis glycosyltransferase